jgi:threonine dehydratase
MHKKIFKHTVDAHYHLRDLVIATPTIRNLYISDVYGANVFLKREDLQVVRSYKLRGAFNKMRSLEHSKDKIVFCASAGNHAQGVAYSCAVLNVKGKIFMPVTTPNQKIKRVKYYGKHWIEVVLVGDSYDDTYKIAHARCEAEQGVFIHPFDDEQVIAGQGTVGLEILNSLSSVSIDYIFVPVGGGGLLSGIVTVFKELSPHTKIIGVEPAGAASMKAAMEQGHVVELDSIDGFVDGAAVKKVGKLPFEIVKDYIDDLVAIPEGKVCTTLLTLYNEDAIVVEPAGALSIAALRFYADEIKGKNVVCIVSGGNNDIVRMEEIKERSLLYEGLKHYFVVQLPQRPGALRFFISEILGPEDDISYFQYSKKNSRERGPVIIGIEVKNKSDYQVLIDKMKLHNIAFSYLNNTPDLFTHLIG